MIAARLSPAALGLALFLSGCAELGDEVVIHSGSGNWTLEDLRIVYSNLEPASRPPLATAEQRLAFARRVVERALLAEEGRRHLATDSVTTPDGARERETILLRRLRVLEAGPAGADSSAAAAAYDRMRVRYRIQSVAFRSEQDARKARDVIDRGGSFQALRAREIGEPPEPDAWVVWQPQPDPVADALVDAEPGSVVGPLRTRGRWLLIRFVEKAPNDPGPWEDLRVRIHQGLRARRELEALDRLADHLRTEAAFRLEEAAVDRIVQRTREAILQPGATEQSAAWAIPALTPAEDSLQLAEWQGGVLTGGDYVRALTRESRGQRPRSSLGMEVRRVVGQEANARLLTAEAERRGLARDWWVLRSIERSEEERAVQRGIAEIFSSADAPQAPPDSLARFLATTRPDLFRSRPTIRILRLDLPSRAAGIAERSAIRRAGGPEARLKEILDGILLPEGSYHLLFTTRNDLPPIAADELFRGGVGTVTGPHALGGVWVVMCCLEARDDEPRTPEEVLAEMRTRQSPSADPRRVAEWVAQREKERGVTIDERVLDALTPGG